MQQLIKKFLEENFPDGNCKPLLALSGGVDSMVLAQLFLDARIPFEAAHMNFGLRADESNGDEEFVKRFCALNMIALHIKKVNAHDEAQKLKKGIQETARILRYQWFHQLLEEKKLTHIATAHHKNDQAETMLFNFIRGAGIGGLSGMKEVEGDIIRPLLPVLKSEILDYATQKKWKFREDSSNNSTGYSRNRIRLRVMPELEDINPGIANTLFHSSKIFLQAEQLIAEKLNNDLGQKLRIDDDSHSLELAWFENYPYQRLLVWHWLKNFGFSSAQMDEVMGLLSSQSGKFIQSATHRLLRDRDHLLLHRIHSTSFEEALIGEYNTEIMEPLPLTIEKRSLAEVVFTENRNEAWFDFDLLHFPLVLRRWRTGDWIKPLGMNGSKKVSDLLVSEKVPLPIKQDVYVLVSGEKIAWVIGHRISQEFCITNRTQQALHFILQKN